MSYFVPAEPLEVETEVKKSRFIARVGCATSREQVMALVERARLDFPDARHVCWAYLLGNPAAACSAGMNDAGEPSGTAGKPILNVIQHKRIGDVVVVVIRYFGGIKLGAGGLVRAYSGAAESALSRLELIEMKPLLSVAFTLDFSQEQLLRHRLEKVEGELLAVEYSEQVQISASLLEESLTELGEFCRGQGIEMHVL